MTAALVTFLVPWCPMLSQHDLQHLASSHRDRQVLTVYLHTTVDNPAERRRWQAEFDHALDALTAAALTGPPADRVALGGAITQVREWLASHQGTMRAPGFMLVAAADKVLLAGPTATVVPTCTMWGTGVHLAPLLGAASLGPASAVLVLDTRTVHVHRFDPPRQLTPVDTFTSHAPSDGEHHLGASMGGFHPGTRGTTAADEAERLQLAARHVLYDQALTRAIETAGAEGWILLAGTPRAVAAAAALVPPPLSKRIIEMVHLDVHASIYEVTTAASSAILAREATRDEELVRDILEEYGARGRGVAGLDATRSALERGGVATLILSEHFVAQHPRESDALIRAALDEGASVREVSGSASEEIDLRAEGVVARLRYRMNGAGTSVAEVQTA